MKQHYLTPQSEVIFVEIESTILQVSGDSPVSNSLTPITNGGNAW